MKFAHAIVWTAAAIVVAAAPALANDSTAELSTGGLVFLRTPDIEMRSEDLFISTQQIRVAYRFFNHADKDVTTLVAFPMPGITVSGPDDNIAAPTEDAKNILGFATKVDGTRLVVDKGRPTSWSVFADRARGRSARRSLKCATPISRRRPISTCCC
jgi:Domain of unknown function (DUF4424)